MTHQVNSTLAVVFQAAQSANVEKGITLLVGVALNSYSRRGGRLRNNESWGDNDNIGRGSGLGGSGSLESSSIGRCGLGGGSLLNDGSSGILSGRGNISRGSSSQGKEGGKIGGEVNVRGGEDSRSSQ